MFEPFFRTRRESTHNRQCSRPAKPARFHTPDSAARGSLQAPFSHPATRHPPVNYGVRLASTTARAKVCPFFHAPPQPTAPLVLLNSAWCFFNPRSNRTGDSAGTGSKCPAPPCFLWIACVGQCSVLACPLRVCPSFVGSSSSRSCCLTRVFCQTLII